MKGVGGGSVAGARGGRVPAGLSKSALLICQVFHSKF